MATLRGQARVLAVRFPAAVRPTALNAVNVLPDLQLPAFLPSLSGGNSVVLNLPSVAGGAPTRLTVPTPVDGLRVAESALPAGVPRLTQMLGLNGAPAANAAAAAPAVAGDRPQTRHRPTQRTSMSPNGRVMAGGYRTS